MRLSKVKLAGFKSFVDPTTISFPSDLVGVVGPNGCGKSNIIDAVRWVMGESSRHLRGDCMEDVIFNGSNARKPVGQATIELVFDNHDGQVGGQYAQYSEIALRRTVARDGQSRYFLNGGACRRRDVTDIFLGTGLGPRSYAIIEQGMISRLIEARPEDLRVYLEEAAGISKYKERRRETELRIRHARENVSRLNDLREVIEKQINHLQRQAKAAEKYQALRIEERRAKAALLALRWRRQSRDAEQAEREVNAHQTRYEQAVAELRRIEAGVERLRARHVEANETFNDVQGDYYRLGGDISRVEQSIAHHRTLAERQQQELAQVRQAAENADVQLDRDRHRCAQLADEIADSEPEFTNGKAELEQHTAVLAAAEQALQHWQARWEDLSQRAKSPEQAAQVERARTEHLARQRAQLEQRAERLSQESDQIDTAALEAEIERLRARAEEAGACLDEQQRALHEALANIRRQREYDASMNQRLDDARGRVQQASGRLTSLEVLQEAALNKQTQDVAQWLARTGLAGAPRLAERIRAEPGWEHALETVLGPTLEAVCVNALETAAAKRADLKKGPLHLLDIDGGAPARRRNVSDDVLLGHVAGPDAINGLLASVYVAADLPRALARREALTEGESVVTPDGVWLGRTWLRVARKGDEHGGVLARAAEIKSLREKLMELRAQVEQQQRERAGSESRLHALEQLRERLQADAIAAHRAQADVETERNRQQQWLEQATARAAQLAREHREIDTQLGQVRAELGGCEARRAQALSAIDVLTGERRALSAQRDTLQRAVAEARETARQHQEQSHRLALRLEAARTTHASTLEGLARMQAQREQLDRRLTQLNEAVVQGGEPKRALEQELTGMLARRLELERALSAARASMQDIEAELREQDGQRLQAERSCEGLREDLETLRMTWRDAAVRCQTLEEQFEEGEFQLDTLLDEMGRAAAIDPAGEYTVEEWEAQVENLIRRIEHLGAINLAAIDEFREQSERKAYLDSQHADLTQALETLDSAIRKIDRETRHRFRETYDKVNARLQEMFPRLFGGGQAHLEMTGDDLLNTGIALMARPPGKRLSTIHLMSGGEKALTAVALIFAVFELNPAPFCLLDEVDAPLDDANVGRFCELVSEMSQRVQFIVITHNKTTMEYARQLVGVTMHEPGVSRLVAVDVDEAMRMATG
ncbi:MAG: chromosome segregation protein SMC [Gammaproteobacteria bacterium]